MVLIQCSTYLSSAIPWQARRRPPRAARARTEPTPPRQVPLARWARAAVCNQVHDPSRVAGAMGHDSRTRVSSWLHPDPHPASSLDLHFLRSLQAHRRALCASPDPTTAPPVIRSIQMSLSVTVCVCTSVPMWLLILCRIRNTICLLFCLIFLMLVSFVSTLVMQDTEYLLFTFLFDVSYAGLFRLYPCSCFFSS